MERGHGGNAEHKRERRVVEVSGHTGPGNQVFVLLLFFKILLFFQRLFIYLFMRDRKRGRDIGRGRSRLHAGNLMWDLILGLQDHSPS